jgi:hypothetical protein
VNLSDGQVAFVMAQIALLNCEFAAVRQQYEAVIGSNVILEMARK